MWGRKQRQNVADIPPQKTDAFTVEKAFSSLLPKSTYCPKHQPLGMPWPANRHCIWMEYGGILG